MQPIRHRSPKTQNVLKKKEINIWNIMKLKEKKVI